MVNPHFLNQSGRCKYFDVEDLIDNNFNEDKISVDECKISSFSIIPVEDAQNYRVNFDVGESREYEGGIIKGFLYENGKFSGKFHLLDNEPYNESWTGNYMIKNQEIIIEGMVYVDNEADTGFFIKINKSRIENTNNKPVIRKYLNKTLYKKLTTISGKLKKQHGNKFYYQKALSLKLKPVTENDLYLAMCIAYSWMPTMLDIYTEDNKSLKGYVPIVQRFSKYKTLRDVSKNEDVIIEDLIKLAKLVNNSIVGASKMLHLFYSKTVPIIDSRVLIGWNQFFKIDYSNNPEIKLPETVPAKIEQQVEMYVKYWKFLLEWNEACEGSKIRDLEEAFYWIGKDFSK